MSLAAAQGALFAEPETPGPDLASYRWILVNSSAGKDSQATLDVVHEAAVAAGVADRIVVVHADLGRVEWPGTAELAEEHAAHYGHRFVKVTRPQGDLLDQIEHRGMFPSSTTRYCTSDHKRGQIRKVMTALADEARAEGGPERVRILNVMGFRAEESPARARKARFVEEGPASNASRRQVDEWLPILDWTGAQVWDRIARAGTRPHPAYEAGMPRLSCCFCVLASRPALVRATQLAPELAETYREVEVRIGHRFTDAISMGELIELGKAAPSTSPIPDWNA